MGKMTILRWMIDPSTKYIMDPRENIEELERAKEKLDGRRKSEEEKLNEAKQQEGVEASAEANRRFSQIRKVVSDADNLKAEYEDYGRSNCFCCRLSRYQLNKRALKLKQAVDDLYEEDLKSGWTAAPTSQKGFVRELDTVSIEGQSTTEKLKRDIIYAVLDDKYVVVGLHGMGGVGKTTLLRHTYNHFRNTDYFKSVIFTTISATPNFVEIRREIAQSLGLKVEKDEDDKNIKFLLSRLSVSTIGKYLLILDDMWEPPVDIGEICIPTPNKYNGCKILVASRSSSVLENFEIRFAAARDSLRLIPVRSLPLEEAWNLFVQKVGQEICCKPEIKPLAEEVVRKCDGLPLAIVVVGATMATREKVGEWKDAVRELAQSAANLEGIEEEVFSKLIFSFEKLQPMEQSLFLYCCLFPEDYNISKEELYQFAIGEETPMWDEMQQYTLQDVRNKVDVLIGKLPKLSMLEDARGYGDVKMHDVMREFALWITSSNNKYQLQYHSTTTNTKFKLKFIAKACSRVSEMPHASEWYQANKISLMFNEHIESLPELPHLCPQLHTLLLRECTGIKEIPQVHFLDQMPALQILDLSGTGVKYLPHSISNLVNLRLLRLNSCKSLREIPPAIGMLVQLIWLDLTSSSFLRELPVETEKLKNLRRLDIRWNSKLKGIPRGVLSGLHKLEELYITRLDTNGIIELSQLTRLTNTTIETVELKKVKVSHWFKPLGKGTNSLVLQNCEIDPSAMWDLLEAPLFDRTVMFTSCNGLTFVPTRGCKWLTIKGCPDLKTLMMVEEKGAAAGEIVEEETHQRNAFEMLEYLNLDRLDQLESICSGDYIQRQPEYGRSFTNLEVVIIKACPKLKVLFTNGITRLLNKLKLLQVVRCRQLVELVSKDDRDLEEDAFPSLEKIFLFELPELKAICHVILKWPSLFTVLVYDCPMFERSLSFGAQHADDDLVSIVKKKPEEEKNKEEEDEEENDDNDDDNYDDEDDEGLTSRRKEEEEKEKYQVAEEEKDGEKEEGSTSWQKEEKEERNRERSRGAEK